MDTVSNNVPPARPVSYYILGVALLAALPLLIPFIAMRNNVEGVNWSSADYVVAWILLFGAGLTFALIIRKSHNLLYRSAIGLTVATALFLIWSNLAVGLIGSENNPANLMYLTIHALLLLGAIISRLKPKGLSLTLFAAAAVQALIALIAIIAGLGAPENTAVQLVFINGFFITLWLAAALLFKLVQHKSPPALQTN